MFKHGTVFNEFAKLIFAMMLVLTSHPSVVFSAPGDRSNRTRGGSDALPDMETRFDEITYSIENIDEAVDDLRRNVSIPAYHAITRNTEKEIRDRFEMGLRLVAAIQSDKKMSDEKKNELLRKVAPAIGTIWFRILRHHHEDSAKDNDQNGEIPQIESPVRTIQRWIPGLRPADWQDLPARVSIGGLMQAIAKEMYLDVRAVLWRERDVLSEQSNGARGTGIWSYWERVRREKLAEDIVLSMQKFGVEIYGQGVSDLEAKFQRFFNKNVLKGIAIRNNRYLGQMYTAYAYVGFAIMGMLFPLMDIVGALDGLSEMSAFYSGVIYFSIWGTLGLIKYLSIPTATLEYLRQLSRIFTDENAKVSEPQETTFTKIRDWIDKRLGGRVRQFRLVGNKERNNLVEEVRNPLLLRCNVLWDY